MPTALPETPNPDQQLLPAKHSKGDLFICDVADAVLKDLIPQMEHPFYSLSKKPETAIRRYEHNGNWLQIVPSVKGLATIYDKDILIYIISQQMEKQKRNEPMGPRVRISSRDLLIFTNRGTAGKRLHCPMRGHRPPRRHADHHKYSHGRRGADRQLRTHRRRLDPPQARSRWPFALG
jgi:hypothetical protein